MAARPASTGFRIAALAATASALAACATFSPDGGTGPVALRAYQELGAATAKIQTTIDVAKARERVAQLLAQPLTAAAAAQIALLNNRGLQADYNELGIAEADYVEATLPPISPSVTVERALTEFEFSIERALAVSVIRLATYGRRRDIAEKEFEAAQQRAIEATFRTAFDARRGFYRAVAAKQRITFLTRAQATAEIAADLTRRQGETGAQTKAVQARAAVFYAEVSAELAQARLDAEREHEALIRVLGLWGRDTDTKLPKALPDLPPALAVADVERQALTRRVDLLAARLRLDATARALGLTEATRYVSLLDLTPRSTTTLTKEGGEITRENTHGVELELEIPIFDLGETASRRARETYLQAMNRLTELAVNIRSEARIGYIAYRATHDIALLYQNKIIPLRQSIDEQTLLEYNGMLVDVFDLLASARDSILSNIAAIDARRDFFLAEVDFQAATIGGGGDREEESSRPVSVAEAAGG